MRVPVSASVARNGEGKRAASTPLSYYKDAGKTFKDAGIDVVFYNANFGTTDEEFNREFEIAKAVGAQMMASSCKVSIAKRVVTFAEKHKMIVALHGHSDITDADAFATPESFPPLWQCRNTTAPIWTLGTSRLPISMPSPTFRRITTRLRTFT